MLIEAQIREETSKNISAIINYWTYQTDPFKNIQNIAVNIKDHKKSFQNISTKLKKYICKQ